MRVSEKPISKLIFLIYDSSVKAYTKCRMEAIFSMLFLDLRETVSFVPDFEKF